MIEDNLQCFRVKSGAILENSEIIASSKIQVSEIMILSKDQILLKTPNTTVR